MAPINPAGPRNLPQLLAIYERVLIVQALQSARGRRVTAAGFLGVKPRYLLQRIKRLGLDMSVFPKKSGPVKKMKKDT